jgi:DNA repair protein RadC
MNSVKTNIYDLKYRAHEEALLVKLISHCFEDVIRANMVSKKLLDKLNSLGEIFYADKYKISAIIPDDKDVLELLELFKELMSRTLRFRVKNTNVISDRKQLLNYLKFNMGGLDIEQCRILLLNKKNIILADEVVSEGTLDTAPLYLKEIVKRALFHGAAAIIIVHNHPSGDPEASSNDLIVTDKIIKACKVFDIYVHDHIIVTKDSYFSILC